MFIDGLGDEDLCSIVSNYCVIIAQSMKIDTGDWGCILLVLCVVIFAFGDSFSNQGGPLYDLDNCLCFDNILGVLER